MNITSKPSGKIFQNAKWYTSSFSANSSDCVEVAYADEFIGVRDSKNRNGAALVFTKSEWRAFVRGVANGEFPIDG